MDYGKIGDLKLFIATTALIHLEYQLGVNIDFIQRLGNLFNDYERTLNKVQIYSKIITYYLLVLSELRNICEYADKLMDYGKIGDFILVYFLVPSFILRLCKMVLTIC